MREPVFDWDEAKNRANERKHGVRFEEALTVFRDDTATRFPDSEHSTNEARYLLLGISYRLRILVVSHCYRADFGVVRIISARKANSAEEADYWDSR